MVNSTRWNVIAKLYVRIYWNCTIRVYRVFNHRQIQSKAFFRREIIWFHWTLWSHLNLHELHFHLVKQSQPCLNNENFLFFSENRVFSVFFSHFSKVEAMSMLRFVWQAKKWKWQIGPKKYAKKNMKKKIEKKFWNFFFKTNF